MELTDQGGVGLLEAGVSGAGRPRLGRGTRGEWQFQAPTPASSPESLDDTDRVCWDLWRGRRLCYALGAALEALLHVIGWLMPGGEFLGNILDQSHV